MKLLFLHGAPAAGKLTVAKALLEIVPGRLSDNHAAIDLARTIFDFGAPGFWELVHTVRCSALDAAAQKGVALVITTWCKMTSAESLIKDLDRFDFAPVPRSDCLTLDTGARPAEAAAREIIGHFGLNVA